MRNFITAAILSVSLLGGAGLADASSFPSRTPSGHSLGHGPVVRGPIERGPVRGGDHGRVEVREHFRDYHNRPERYAEHFEFRAGFSWHAGDWQWNGYEWIWTPGYYVRVVL